MRFHWLQTPHANAVLAIATSLILGACGGGGATLDPNQGGALTITPQAATFYAGIPATITIAGGRTPYAVSSSDPLVLPVPDVVNGHSFQVVPNNPGVIDPGLPPGSVPRRTVVVSAHDSTTATTVTTSIAVAQNFLTGYGVSFTSNCPSAAGATAAPAACAGGETVVTLADITNGSLYGNRSVRFDVLRGPFMWVFPGGAGTGTSITVTTDHSGIARVVLRVNTGVSTQLAMLRVIDVATGVYSDQIFTIQASAPGIITAIPSIFTFTGPTAKLCGTGSGDFLVFDGVAPYTAISSSPNINVTPSQSTTQPGHFTLSVTNPFVCLTTAAIVVTDANLSRATVSVTTSVGTATPPPLAVSPTSITLSCGQSGSASVVGGNPPYIVNSTDSRVSATTSGNTLTITRTSPSPFGTAPNTAPSATATVSVTDGASVVSVTVTHPPTCP